MRQPTDSELARFQAWLQYAAKYATKPNHIWPFDHGFDAGCAHSAERIAALEAENARLRACLFKATKDLKRAVKYWRDYAANDYHQTYNPERGKGLRIAADDLENYIYDAWGRNDVPSK